MWLYSSRTIDLVCFSHNTFCFLQVAFRSPSHLIFVSVFRHKNHLIPIQVLVTRSPRQLIFFTPHFSDKFTLTISQITHLVSFAVPYSRFRERPPTFLLVSRCMHHAFATFDAEPTPCSCSAAPFARSAHFSAYFCPSPCRFDVKFRGNHARFVSLNARHFMSAPPTKPESPPPTVSSRKAPPVYAEFFSVPKNNYAPVQLTFQSSDRFLFPLLCICVTCFFFLNLTFALYLHF